MKTQVLAVRLPQDQLDLLQKMADSRGLKISELAKEMLSAGIDGHRTGNSDNANVLQRLEQLETNLLGAQTWLADAVITDIKATAAARFYARLGAENTDELISYLANNQPLEPNKKLSGRRVARLKKSNRVKSGSSRQLT